MENRIKLWLGMGAWLLASASPTALAAAESHPSASKSSVTVAGIGDTPAAAVAQAPHTGHGGEGGEGGEAGEADIFADASPDEALLGRLLLIKGHLRVGKELYDRGRPDDALPHYLHPVEELYEEIGKELKERKARQFAPALKRLADAVKAKAGMEVVAEEQKKVMAAIDSAARAVPTKQRLAPDFTAKVAVLILKQAVAEYEEALEGERVANPVEYQDARGFVWTAREHLLGARKELQAKDPEAYKQIMAQLDKLRTAWPNVVPPAQAAMPFGEVQASVSQIELRTSRFH